ncbi:hypothetical protein [Streptomyces sp. NPDC060194]|uniref:hypothetical protein n=1 Tax=Streptomyces sp. NPDC060194 TaxID=3347069 RepID=UPI00366776FC
MDITISLLVLLLIIAAVMMRSGALKGSHAVICVLLGFLLAGTQAAPSIENGLSSTAKMVSGIGF